MLDAVRAATGHDRVMRAAGFGYRSKAVQAIGDNETGRLEVLSRLATDFGFAKALHFGEAHRDGMMLLIRRNRRNKRCLVGCASTTFAAMAFPTPIRVVQLDDTHQGLHIAAFLHHLHQFVFDAPSRTIAHAELTLQFQRRDPVLGLCHEEHGQKPSSQRQFGIGKDGPAR